ncbi:MAG: hypothetical protein ACI8ZN_000784 [Bacteroidia bacterium]|jgi:hypothetical protein
MCLEGKHFTDHRVYVVSLRAVKMIQNLSSILLIMALYTVAMVAADVAKRSLHEWGCDGIVLAEIQPDRYEHAHHSSFENEADKGGLELQSSLPSTSEEDDRLEDETFLVDWIVFNFGAWMNKVPFFMKDLWLTGEHSCINIQPPEFS